MAASRKRVELERAIGQQIGREMSARTIFFHQAIANVAGVSMTDMKCLDYIHRGERVTAGDLARMTGLTTGAITAAIDRLERAGLARRERSDIDRRKVYIQICESPVMAKLAVFFDSLAAEMGNLASGYSTRELETIQDFCLRCIEIVKRQTEVVERAAKASAEPTG